MSYNNKITAMDRIGNKMDIGQNMFTYIADEIGPIKIFILIYLIH